MKKIGVLFGQERSFPMAFIERVNSKGIESITAEPVRIDKAGQGEKTDYAVIIDRISQDVPFYRAWLKNAGMTGAAVINNPFWWSADDKFFNNALADKIGVNVPRTVLLPSYKLPDDTTDKSFRNLIYPFDWNSTAVSTSTWSPGWAFIEATRSACAAVTMRRSGWTWTTSRSQMLC